MARTRGAADIAERERDEPTLAELTEAQIALAEQARKIPDIQPESGAPELPALIPPPLYTCDPTTLDRNMEASELAEILAMVLGAWSLQVPADQWSNLRPDVRRHFKRIA